MKPINRRDFLLQSLAASLSAEHLFTAGWASALMLSARRALASEGSDPKARFLLIRIHGGMDSTLALHPVLTDTSKFDSKDLYTGYKDGAQPMKQIQGTAISLGPAAAPVAKFAPQMAIVRGINMGANDLGHPSAMQYITAGRTLEAAPGWISYLGSTLTDGTAVITNAPMQRGTLRPFPILLTPVLRNGVLGTLNSGPTLLGAYKDAGLGVQQYLNLMGKKDQLLRFRDALDDSTPMDQQAFDAAIAAGLSEDQAKTDATPTTSGDEDVAVAGLYAGLSRVAQIDFSLDQGGSIDTHANHIDTHLTNQKLRWVRVAAVLEKLQKLDLLKDTLVAVVTEFNRTPGLNDSQGKDHNYPDSAMALFGRGLRGGSVVGDRSLFTRAQGFPYAYWAGAFIDFAGSGHSIKLQNGQTIPTGADLIRPPDIWASVISSLNSDLISQLPDGARVIPGIFS